MRKRRRYLLLCLAAVLMTACGSPGKKPADDTAPKYVFTYAENQAEDYPTTQGAYRFAELVKERTGGRIEIQINADGILGDERAVVEQMQFGGVDFARVSLSTMGDAIPKLNVLQLPYLDVYKRQRLDATRMELLKSQINPHFLFNTLNMIACTAKLEEAATTERMISSMSNLFRYNLKTSEQIVPLSQEMKVVKDYLYIQQMRFGSRIQFRAMLKVDEDEVMVPAFNLQPVVENAIIHGLSKKEQGGLNCLRVWQEGENVTISVADTGVGMDEKSLEELLRALNGKRTARVGIGVGNIYQRIHIMYCLLYTSRCV